MPARNARDTVARAVSTTLRELHRDDELLVLDDGSTDGTGAVLAAVHDPRLRVITTEQSVGVARGLTRLLGEARHGVVARMDADDLTLPGRFRLQRRALRGHDIAFGNIVPFGDVRSRVAISTLVGLPSRALHLWLLLENPVAHSTMIARKSVLLDVGGYRACPAEDWDLWLRAAAGGARMRRTVVPVTAYRIHQQQISGSEAYRASLSLDPLLEEAWRLSLAASGYPDPATAAFAARTEPGDPVREWLVTQAASLSPARRALLARRLRLLGRR